MLDSPAHSLPIARMRRDTCIVVASDCITTPYAERCVVLLVRPLLYVVPLFPLTTLSQEGIRKVVLSVRKREQPTCPPPEL